VGTTGDSLVGNLGRAHAALLADLRELEQAVRPDSGESLVGLRARLGATHAHVTEHFRFEEEDGYMDAVRKREPRLERSVQQLAEEHAQLRRLLEAIIGGAGAAASLGDALREEIRGWTECVRRHEARENDLVQGAFNLDISAGD
jgi:hypothetical protein